MQLFVRRVPLRHLHCIEGETQVLPIGRYCFPHRSNARTASQLSVHHARLRLLLLWARGKEMKHWVSIIGNLCCLIEQPSCSFQVFFSPNDVISEDFTQLTHICGLITIHGRSCIQFNGPQHISLNSICPNYHHVSEAHHCMNVIALLHYHFVYFCVHQSCMAHRDDYAIHQVYLDFVQIF